MRTGWGHFGGNTAEMPFICVSFVFPLTPRDTFNQCFGNWLSFEEVKIFIMAGVMLEKFLNKFTSFHFEQMPKCISSF